MKVLSSLNEIIDIGLKFKFNWYRGHSELYNDLTPKVFRPEYYSELHLKASSENPELHIIEEFKRLTPSLGAACPNPTDHLQWLILMQHYGAPTRLLDWSESILVAAFFAVNENSKQDAEIWRIYPQQLNFKSTGNEGFPILSTDRHLQFLTEEPLYDNVDLLVKKLQFENPLDFPMAFYPVLSFPRISAQGGVFTIHPKPTGQNSLTQIFTGQVNFLNKYVIPADRKQSILADLVALGINYRTLFANLDGLSRDLQLKYSNPFWNRWGQPLED